MCCFVGVLEMDYGLPLAAWATTAIVESVLRVPPKLVALPGPADRVVLASHSTWARVKDPSGVHWWSWGQRAWPAAPTQN